MKHHVHGFGMHMRPVPQGHPARPRSAGARHPYPTRQRIDWPELGWRIGPYAAALICFIGLYFAGGPT